MKNATFTAQDYKLTITPKRVVLTGRSGLPLSTSYITNTKDFAKGLRAASNAVAYLNANTNLNWTAA